MTTISYHYDSLDSFIGWLNEREVEAQASAGAALTQKARTRLRGYAEGIAFAATSLEEAVINDPPLWLITDGYSDKLLAIKAAEQAVDALAAYSLSMEYADPRDLAYIEAYGDVFYRQEGDILGMTFENTTLIATRWEGA